jgi:hypothetical protein
MCVSCVRARSLLLRLCVADCGAQGVHALLRMCQEGPEAHLQDGRYDNLYPFIHFFVRNPFIDQ